MIFGISEQDFFDKTKLKIIDGIAGAGKSTSVTNYIESHNKTFCLASFSNALKFAAQDKFGCEVDTICGLCFTNTPMPRSSEREVAEYNTVVLDEVLLDGIDCINWMKHNVGKVNIIALTDSHQMLSVESSDNTFKAFNKLCKSKSTIYVQLTETKRARNEETKELYNRLFNLDSNVLLNIKTAQELLQCDIVNFEDIVFDPADSYICHTNKIEHEVYKRYDLSSRRDIALIPKNHISRKRVLDFNKYPICDQITATEKRIDSYLQAACCGSPVRFQGREVVQGTNCYYIVEPDSLFTGREIYTVGTRCHDMASIHMVVMNIEDYKGPSVIRDTEVVTTRRLDIKDHDKTYKHVTQAEMNKLLKEYGEEDTYYVPDYILSGENIIYSTLSNAALNKFADINEDPDNYTVTIRKKSTQGRVRTIKSVTRKDTTMHFDFMDKIYEMLQTDITPPRIKSPRGCKKDNFEKLCDIYSAFPTVLHNADMPKAGIVYTERSDDLLNFYKYNGHVVNNGALITEELANKLGESEYVFSTSKQKGCQLGHYTYEQCHTSKEKKAKINENFKWGILEKDYYKREQVVKNGEPCLRYVKHEANTLELVACALWSSLCCIMLDAVSSINAKDFLVVTDGLYYNGDDMPKLPEWCDYRIEDKEMERFCGKVEGEKYSNIIFKTYEDLPTENQLKVRKRKQNT